VQSPNRGRTHDADARNGLKPFARFVRAMLNLDAFFDRSDQRLQRLKLSRQHNEARSPSTGKGASRSSATIARIP
jgi:hypothetical protein